MWQGPFDPGINAYGKAIRERVGGTRWAADFFVPLSFVRLDCEVDERSMV